MTPLPSSSLRDSDTFPNLSNLPGDRGFEDIYHIVDPYTGNISPRRHWCLIAEITKTAKFIRLSIYAKDRDGVEFPVHVHTDDRGVGMSKYCQEGYTLVLMYAERHYFADGTVGIRLEEGASVKVLPYSVATLMAANDRYFGQEGKGACDHCKAGEKETAGGLKNCARCKVISYCGKNCQNEAWSSGHKEDCKVLTQIHAFASKDWELFQGWFEPHVMRPPPSGPGMHILSSLPVFD
ncbi:hypothetical protein FIBSPDRAFT_826305 [Athelia psychrophila]|uniref:MYND-type domain-containing protein n=1 Tax=Athelia psychrophila TaxID=1759441 RepID=A0A166JJX4_9AGAM|nr:hypothetical protein FIBSPDRAFT_826305 [Fibularhizoctonia sp. CBS 109695]